MRPPSLKPAFISDLNPGPARALTCMDIATPCSAVACAQLLASASGHSARCRSAEEADAQSLRAAVLLDELDAPPEGEVDARAGSIIVELTVRPTLWVTPWAALTSCGEGGEQLRLSRAVSRVPASHPALLSSSSTQGALPTSCPGRVARRQRLSLSIQSLQGTARGSDLLRATCSSAVQVSDSEELAKYVCSSRVVPLMSTRMHAKRTARLVQQPMVAAISDQVSPALLSGPAAATG